MQTSNVIHTVKLSDYYEVILKQVDKAGMCIIYNTKLHYILALKYWDSKSNNVCGDKYMYQGENSQDVFRAFKRFFFDSTFNLNHLFIVHDDGAVYLSTWKNSNPRRWLFGGKKGRLESYCGHDDLISLLEKSGWTSKWLKDRFNVHKQWPRYNQRPHNECLTVLSKHE